MTCIRNQLHILIAGLLGVIGFPIAALLLARNMGKNEAWHTVRRSLLWMDPTTYTLADLRSEPLNSTQSEGVQVRSFQLAIARLAKRPNLASILIHKSGPLNDESHDRHAALAGVYLRGMQEVGKLLAHVTTRPA